MPRFFVPSTNIRDGRITITGDDAWHIARSLRMAVGEEITVCDMHGGTHRCVLRQIADTEVVAESLSYTESSSESPVRTVLYQAFPKGDKMDLIVQKAVESGVYAIVPFFSDRCISRPEGASLEKKMIRWQRIALEAAKQCGRGIIPKVCTPLSYKQMLADAKTASARCFCYEGDGTSSLKTTLNTFRAQFADLPPEMRTLSLVIGSEGGFSGAEAAAAVQAGLALCGLGKRILRCESASGFALACIAYEFEL